MERDKSLDGLKFLLICLVVIGHLIEPSRYTDRLSCYTYSVIYSFHMPLFILLSGYFYKKRPLQEEVRRCLPFMETFLLTHLIFALLRCGGALSPRAILGSLLNFNNPSWYLLALICWRLASGFLFSKMRFSRVLGLSIAVEIISFLLIRRSSWLPFGRILLFYPIFLFGHGMKGKISELRRWKWMIYTFGLLSLAFILMTSGRLQHLLLFNRTGLRDFIDQPYPLHVIYAFRYLLVACGVLISLSLLLATNGKKLIESISRFGKSTLFIYVGQTWLYAPIFRVNPTFVESLALSAVAIVLLTFMASWPMSKVLLNPVSTLLSRRK